MQTAIQTALNLIWLFLFGSALFALKKCYVAIGNAGYDLFNEKLSDLKKPTLNPPPPPS